MSDAWKCPECNLDYGTLHPPIASNTVKSLPRRYREVLEPASADEDNESVIRTRPAPAVWSAIEYAAHVADTVALFAVVIDQMRTRDDVDVVWRDPDEQVDTDKYNEQSKADVLARLSAGADALVAAAEKVNANDWARTAQFPWGERDMLTMLQNAAHEGAHHLQDIEKGLATVRDA